MIRSYSRIFILFLFSAFSTTALLPWEMPLFATSGIAQDDGVVQPENYFEQLMVNRSDYKWFSSLPTDLRNYEFCHMNSIKQQKKACAWYAAFNAKALQEIVKERKQLTAANIREYIAKQLVPHVQQNEDSFKKLLGVGTVLEGLDIYQIPTLVDHLGIKNYYDICIYPWQEGDEILVSSDNDCSFLSDERVKFVSLEGYNTKYILPDISLLHRSIKENPAPVVHILLTVPSSTARVTRATAQEDDKEDDEEDKAIKNVIVHAVLVTIIKRGDKKPLLVYLNSNGNSLGRYLSDAVFDTGSTTQNRYIADFITSLDKA